MANNNNLPKPKIKSKDSKAVIILKLISLIAILLIPLAFIIIVFSKNFLLTRNLNVKTAQQNNKNINSTDEYNFEAPLPAGQTGDISKVPKQKIDSLFNNLKK